MGWKNGAILRKKVRQPKPKFLPYPDSKGIWEIHDRAYAKYSIIHAVERDNQIVLIGLHGERLRQKDIPCNYIQFRKRK